MELNIADSQELLSIEDWQALTSFFELLIKADEENKKAVN
jgi:hypothetical protein